VTDRHTDRQTPHDGIGRAYASHRAAKNILNVLGKRKNDMLAVHLTKTYCLPILLYSCEIWAASPVDMRSVDVSWNNAFRKLFNWRDSVKPLQFYCFCLPASVFVRQRRVLFWLKMVRSDNVILHTLAGCSRDSVVALLDKYCPIDSHCVPSMLSSYVVKRWFWLYFSNLCQAVCFHSLIVCSICTAFITVFIFIFIFFCIFFCSL